MLHFRPCTTYQSLCAQLVTLFSKHASSLLYSHVINSSHHLASMLHFSYWTKYINCYVIGWSKLFAFHVVLIVDGFYMLVYISSINPILRMMWCNKHASHQSFYTKYQSLCAQLIRLFSKHASSLLYSYVINSSHHFASMLHFSIWAKHICIFVFISSALIGTMLLRFCIRMWSIHHII